MVQWSWWRLIDDGFRRVRLIFARLMQPFDNDIVIVIRDLLRSCTRVDPWRGGKTKTFRAYIRRIYDTWRVVSEKNKNSQKYRCAYICVILTRGVYNIIHGNIIYIIMREAAMITICTCGLAINGGGCGSRRNIIHRYIVYLLYSYSSRILYIILL